MKGTATVLSAVLIVSAIAAIPLSGAATPDVGVGSQADDGSTPSGAADDATNDTLPPGARLAGAIGAQEAEIDGEIEGRAFGIAVAKANTNDSRAAVVARQVGDLDARLTAFEERKRELQRAHRNGTITTATYSARMTELSARTQTARGLANRSDEVARGLPAEALEHKGVNVTAIGTLQQRAANLTGPEVASVARSIAGPDVGKPVSAGSGRDATDGSPGNGAGPPPHAGNPSDGNRSVVDSASGNVSDVVDNTTDGVDEETDLDGSTDVLNDSTDVLDDSTDVVDEAKTEVDASTAVGTATNAVENTTDVVETTTDGVGTVEGAVENSTNAIENTTDVIGSLANVVVGATGVAR